ncbi:hypothetical protein EDC01DRAFT_780849 [Geopyxis carbonaria]|nr:hypothetical protein EDC01DRAFT_780849 [Geopyxis carbonaria]
MPTCTPTLISTIATDNSPSNISLLPNPAGHDAGDHWTKRQYHAAMTIILRSLQEPSHNGTNIVCADGRTRLGYPRIASFVSDFPEQTLFTLTVYMWCPRCELDPEKFPGLDQTAIPRTTERYAGLSIDQCHRRGKWKFEPDFSLAAGHKGFEPYKCIHPDRLHQLLTGKEEALRQIDERFHAIPHFTGLRAFGKGRITKVKQFTGAEYKDMLRVWIPALAPLFTGYPQHITFMRHLTDFILISGYHHHTEDTLGYLKEALDGMAAGMHLWAPYRNSTNTGDDSNVKVPTMHAMSHYIECIQDVGSCDHTDTEAFESAHHWMCKLAYRASNKVNYDVQMLAWEQRLFYIKSRLSVLRHILKEKPTSRHADLCLRMLINKPMLPKAIAAPALIGISHGRRLKISTLTFHKLSLDVSFTEGLANHFKYLADKHPEHLGPRLRRNRADARWWKTQKVRRGTGLCCVSESVNEDTGIRQEFARCTSSWRNSNKRYNYVMYSWTVGKADSRISAEGLRFGQIISVFCIADQVFAIHQGFSTRIVHHDIVFLRRLGLVNSGHVNKAHRMASVQRVARIDRGTSKEYIVFPVAVILRPAHLVPTGTPGKYFINNYISLEFYNTVY